ncbi:MAG: EAL domain-containing protein [Wenzhouxiangella sp.]
MNLYRISWYGMAVSLIALAALLGFMALAGEVSRLVLSLAGLALLLGGAAMAGLVVVQRRLALPARTLVELRAARDQLLRAQRVGNIGSWEFDFRRQRLEWSDQALKIFGVERESMGGSIEDFLRIVHPDDRDSLRRRRAEWLRQGGEFEAEYRIVRPDGEERWVHACAEMTRAPDGSVAYSTGTLQDLTEYRHRELQVRRLRQLLEGSEDLCGILDPSGRYRWVNQAYARMYGVVPEAIVGRTASELVGEEYFERRIKPHLERCFAGQPQRFETAREFSDQSTHRLLARYYPIDLPGDSGRDVGFVLTDITESHQMVQRLQAKETALRESYDALDDALKTRQALINSLPAYIALLDNQANVVDVNEQWRHFGEQNDFQGAGFGVGVNYLEVCETASGDCAEEAAAVAGGLRDVLVGERKQFSLEYPCHSPDEQRWFRVMFNRLSADRSVPEGVVAMHVDITERKLGELQLEKLAFEDPLTGQLSRNGFTQRLQMRVADGDWLEQGIVVMVDVINQRDINDVYGYESGDRLLIELGHRIRTRCGQQGLVGRAGGDEFVVYLAPDPTSTVEQALHGLRSAVDRPFQFDGVDIEVELWIGYTELGGQKRDSADLIREAELALFENRKNDGAPLPWVGFTPELDAQTRERIRLTRELRHAIAADEFELHFQPKVNLADGSLMAAEALIRWHHPTRGLQPPGLFISVAEQSQLIGPIGDWALRDACRQLRCWQDAGLSIVRVAVNVSLVQFVLGDFPAKVSAALKDFNVDPSALSLEITESVFERHSQDLMVQLRELHDMGVQLSLDDFGTGYSSLLYLQRYPFDEIKIDRAFVSKLLQDDYSRNIVRTVIDMARALGAEVVAEGIESPEITAALLSMGVKIGQGFYYSIPLESEDFRWLLEERSRLPLHVGENE